MKTIEKMKKLTLYKNNRIDRKYTEDFKHIITNYINSDWQKLDLPFERKFLSYLTEYYNDSTFDTLEEKQWQYIYSTYKELR